MSLPQTAFEARGHTGEWTTIAQERTYITALLAAVPSITQKRVGEGAGGADLFLYTIGSGPHPILFVAQQHGAELAGREIMLSRLRDWATSTDPAIMQWLRESTVLIMPTCHPDNTSNRNNPAGMNINREHVSLAAPEARAIHRVIRDYRPEVIADLHEMSSGPMEDVETSKMINPNASPGLLELSDELEQEVREAAETAGYSWKPYWNYRDIGPEYLSMAAGLRHAVGLLTETSRTTGDNSDSADRYARYVLIADRIQRWHHQHKQRVGEASLRSRREAEYPGSRFDLLVAHDTGGPVLQPVPTGYTVTPAQRADLATHVEIFELDVEGVHLNAKHHTRGMVHYIAHEQSLERIISGAPVFQVDQPPFEEPPVEIGIRYSLRFRTGGRTYDAWMPSRGRGPQ